MDTHLIPATTSVLQQLTDVLGQLSDEQYSAASTRLSQASIGQHTRHLAEFYQCLFAGYPLGRVNYEHRNRNKQLEGNRAYAIKCIERILYDLKGADKEMQVACMIGTTENELVVTTTYYRELLYALEHAIHHMALIRVAVEELTDIVLHNSFGVAPSTLNYRQSCVQ